MGGKCRLGLDWCRDSIPAAANRHDWVLPSAVTFICARYSFTVRVLQLWPRSVERPSMPGSPVCCIGAIRTLQPLRWRTRMHAPCGRYLPTTESFGPITSLRGQAPRSTQQR